MTPEIIVGRALQMNTNKPKISVLFVEARYFDSLRLPTDENLSLYILATFLKDSMPNIEFNFDFANSINFLKYAQRKPYDLCGIYSTTQAWNQTCDLAGKMRQLGVLTIVGGPHISSLPESLSEHFSVGCIGPGEYVLKRIVEIYLDHGELPEFELSRMDGIVFYSSEGLKINRSAPKTMIMDHLPSPYKYYLKPDKIRANLLSSMGCPYHCYFCSAKVINPTMKMFSAEHIVEEMEYLDEKHGITNYKFIDDNFLASQRRVERIIELLRKRKMIGRVSISCTSSSKFINEEIAEMLKLLKAQHVAIGFESGSEAVLRILKCGRISLQDHERAVKLLNARGIKISGTFILGTPGETIEDIQKTMSFVKNNRIHNISAYLIKPLPGTQFWDALASSGKIDPNKVNFQELALTNYDSKWYFNNEVPFSATINYLMLINRIGAYRTIRYNLANRLLYQAGWRQLILSLQNLKARIKQN